MRLIILLITTMLGVSMHGALAEDTHYQQPPAPIPDILDSPDKPYLLVSPDGSRAVAVEAAGLPEISQIAIDAVEVAGLRINPATHGPVRTWFSRGARVTDMNTLKVLELDLPAPMRGHNFDWSPDSRHLAWSRTTDDGTRLWVCDTKSGQNRQLSERRLNTAEVEAYHWLPDGSGLVCAFVPEDLGPPPTKGAPQGPIIEESLGRKAAARTYTNLLKDAHDEALFEHYMAAELVEVSLDGTTRSIHASLPLLDMSTSPDGSWLLVEHVKRPYSRSVPLWRFPQRAFVLDMTTGESREICELELAEDVPIAFGSVRTGPRSIIWRQDQPATLCWAEALDGGDADVEVAERDRIMLLAAPFSEAARELCRTQDRYGGIYWGDASRALLYESWYTDRRQRILRLNPTSGVTDLLMERSSEDAYTDPGRPRTMTWPDGHWSLRFAENGDIFWTGKGASEEGVYPFLSRMDWDSGNFTRIWQSQDPWYERVVSVLDSDAGRLVLRRESQQEPVNDYLYMPDWTQADKPANTQPERLERITSYQDPAPQLADMHKEVVRYTRDDGVELSATLYLPPGYRKEKDGPLPFLLWVYPREFKSRSSAGRVTSSPNTFSRPSYTSVLFLLTQGIGIMANPTMPILGEDDTEPNDSYLEQLEAGASAAIEYLVSQGVGDRKRMAIGGHSYGAFTAANLLAHTDLFRTAICRSGAYNRTLTPFGFQGEERSFWEADSTYLDMSPFMHADKIKEPLLMIHGMEDPNTGTFPIQSERFYEALKGLGGHVRLVKLPAEGHGYRSRESIGHVLWEMCRWSDLHLKSEPESVRKED